MLSRVVVMICIGFAGLGIVDSARAQSLVGEPLLTGPAGAVETLSPPREPFFDADRFRGELDSSGSEWVYQTLPNGLVYRPYLANPKESRLSTQFVHPHDHLLWEATVGTRLSLLRYGTRDQFRPEGFEWDAEGSAQARFDLENNTDMQSVDFRGGTSLTYGVGRQAIKFGYYHLSSHLGDEFLLKNPNYPRLNFARDVLSIGYSFYVTPELRFFAEAGWAFFVDVSQPWEFQFGTEWAPSYPTGPRGAPFLAIHGQLREELDFGGTLTVQTGWAWRGDEASNLLRIGLHYQNGGSNQLSFYQEHEQQIGLGFWYDR